MADLYISWSNSAPLDSGVRPISPCWPPNAIWTNASIWMSYPPNHPDPAKRNATALRARIGEQVLINVEAYSRGASFPFNPGDSPFVRCQVWVCTGANGVGPVSSLSSSGGSNGFTSIVFGTISGRFAGVASVLWTPAATDNLVFDPSGAAHVCIAANLVYVAPSSPSSPGSGPRSQGQFLPRFPTGQSVQTIFPCGDGPLDPSSLVPIGHFHGQKNIQVLSASAAEPLSSIQVLPRGLRKQVHTLWLAERTGSRRLAAALREHLLAHPSVSLVGGRPRRQRMVQVSPSELERFDANLAEAIGPKGCVPSEPLERAHLAGGGRLVLADRADVRIELAKRPLDTIEIRTGDAHGTKLEISVRPKEPEVVVVDLSAASQDPPGTVRVFDLAERDEDGSLVGGTTFITLSDR